MRVDALVGSDVDRDKSTRKECLQRRYCLRSEVGKEGKAYD